MWVCSVVLNHEMDSLAVSAIANTKLESVAFINTDNIADYLSDMFAPSETEGLSEARKNNDLQKMLEIAGGLGVRTEIFFNKLGA